MQVGTLVIKCSKKVVLCKMLVNAALFLNPKELLDDSG